ncbi:DUF551 domain-containing protein [[Clostridium] innocuum]|nr:DUF551 domain-containing protein [[Clostridium] innocuum]MCR0575868.1 DUF551 domain-containing protein [[Clostridium] innocuum]
MNTDEFKHFKLHSDSTLKSLTKDELISYIHMLYHNWGVSDESYYNVMEYAKQLQQQCQWIPVEERLPENEKDIGRNYLVTLKYSNLNSIIATCARFEPSGRWLRYCAIGEVDVTDEVIAWMPLPEAYGDGR